MTSAITTTTTQETDALTIWEGLAERIAVASQEDSTKEFNYRHDWDSKQARSWVASLRRIKGSIERARKDAKAVHLERGRAVDETAKLLEATVQGLIEPHQSALDAIAAEEQARIDRHRAVLDRITAIAEGITTSDEARQRLAELDQIETAGLEEFATAAANRKADAIERLSELTDTLERQEAERAELEALRAEKAARDEAERVERIRREAIEQERRQAAEAAQRAEQERQAREAREADRRQREAAEAERRERAAVAAAEAARQAQERAEEEARRLRDQQEREAAARRARDLEAEQRRRERQLQFRAQLVALMAALTREQVADAIAAGTLHPALSVDWAQV